MLLNFPIFSKDFSIKNVRVYDSNQKMFSVGVDLVIQGDKIKEIRKSTPKKIEFYILPTFCDLDVTLGMDSLGYGLTRNGVEVALNSFLYHGFSHLFTVNNPPWIYYLKQKNRKAPIIKHGNKNIIYDSKEYPEIPTELFTVVHDKSELSEVIKAEMKTEIPLITILNRYHSSSSFYFDSDQFRETIKNSSGSRAKIIVSNYGDPIGILDSIRAGVQYLKDPIPLSILQSIPIEVFEKITYIPQLNVYHNLYIQLDEKLVESENIYRSSLSKFYKKYYYEEVKKRASFKTIPSNELESIKKEYPEYTAFLKEQKNRQVSILISGGSGNYLSFPGVSAIRELLLLNEILDNPYHLINSITNKSCSLFLDDYDGTIKENGKANLLLYRENPLENLNKISDIHTMYINGEKVNREEIQEKKK